MKLTIEEAFRRYGDAVFRAAFSVCRSGTDADDVVQDTFLKYHTRAPEFMSEAHLKAWLLRVAMNRAKDLAAAHRRKNEVAWETFRDTLTFEQSEDRDLFDAVMRLPEKYRAVIHLFYYEEYAINEIADLLHRRPGTVKSQLSRARALLKTTLTEEWNDDE
ncbi:MAG: sigma-70 family RNA polymerase sigma factor [Oscillospiraceae bacterium]|nr:sigma-70 family RNA polymerase sigma factor [Oscillospiraceae bacterium]